MNWNPGRLLLLLGFSFFSLTGSAHFYGSVDLTYRWLDSGKYEIKVFLLHDQMPFVQSIETLAPGNYILRIKLNGDRQETLRITKARY